MVITPLHTGGFHHFHIIVAREVFPHLGIGVVSVSGVHNAVVVHNKTFCGIAQAAAVVHIAAYEADILHSSLFGHCADKAGAVETRNRVALAVEMAFERALRGTHTRPGDGRTVVIVPRGELVTLLGVDVDVLVQDKPHSLAAH